MSKSVQKCSKVSKGVKITILLKTKKFKIIKHVEVKTIGKKICPSLLTHVLQKYLSNTADIF
jgi:hypothetical protein